MSLNKSGCAVVFAGLGFASVVAEITVRQLLLLCDNNAGMQLLLLQIQRPKSRLGEPRAPPSGKRCLFGTLCGSSNDCVSTIRSKSALPVTTVIAVSSSLEQRMASHLLNNIKRLPAVYFSNLFLGNSFVFWMMASADRFFFGT